MPCSTLNIVVFSLLEVSLNVKLLSKVLVSVLEQIFSKLCYESYHMVILLGFSVDVNCQVWLVSGKVHSLCIFIVSFIFKLSSLLDI
jgi:hypothetical protein